MVSVNAIQGTLIADNAITAVHIATNAVSGTLVADNAITATHIAQNTITVTQIADDAIESAKIADGIITTNHLNKAMISSQTEVTAASGDFVLIGDTSDSNNLKKAPVSDFGNDRDGAAVFNESGAAVDFRIEGDTEQNLFFVEGSADKIGIGTNSPDVVLEIAGAHTSSIGMLHLDSTDHAFISLDAAGSSNDKGIYFQEAGTAQVIIDHDGSANLLRIHDGSTTHMVIEDGGDVGIGTTNPSSKLTVTEAGDGNTPTMHIIDSADTEVAWFEGNRAGDTGAFIAIRHNPSSQANSNRSGIKFQADDNAGNVTNYAKITQYISDNTNGSEDSSLAFNIMKDGTDTEMMKIDSGITLSGNLTMMSNVVYASQVYVADRLGHLNDASTFIDFDTDTIKFATSGESMRITSDNRVYIGTTSPSTNGILSVEAGNAGLPMIYCKNTNADSVGIRAEVNSNASSNFIYEAMNTDGQVWKIRNDGDHFGTDTSIGSLSDSRLKKDVSDLTYDINKFKQYRPVEFNWINPELHKSASGKSRGFLAQEVKALDDYYVDKYEAQGDDVPLVDSDGKAHSTKFGYKDAMYISVIKQLITRIEALESA